jgi:hypothetical protein
MPPEQGRASQACSACRKQKTRCYETGDGQPCLRCSRMGQQCSLAGFTQQRTSICEPTTAWPNNAVTQPGEDQRARYMLLTPMYDEVLTPIRFERLEWTISTLTQRVNILEADSPRSNRYQSEAAYPTPMSDSHYASPSQPLFTPRNIMTDSKYSISIEGDMQDIDRNISNSPLQASSEDIISKRLVSPQEAFTLLDLFQAHYARWVSFDKSLSSTVLFENVRRFPLLLTACCLIAIR